MTKAVRQGEQRENKNVRDGVKGGGKRILEKGCASRGLKIPFPVI